MCIPSRAARDRVLVDDLVSGHGIGLIRRGVALGEKEIERRTRDRGSWGMLERSNCITIAFAIVLSGQVYTLRVEFVE